MGKVAGEKEGGARREGRMEEAALMERRRVG